MKRRKAGEMEGCQVSGLDLTAEAEVELLGHLLPPLCGVGALG